MHGQIDSAQRIKAGQDAREGLGERARKGLNAGGRVYGYDNVWRREDGTERIADLGARKPFADAVTDYRVNHAEEKTIQQIFRMYADGYGPRKIAKTLNGDPRYAAESKRYFNGERPRKPIVGKRGTGSWAPAAIRDMLRNERYAGVIVFGLRKNDYDENGEKYRVKGDRIVRTPRPDLRIVPEALWEAVQRRIGAEEKSYLRSVEGKPFGRPARGLASRYMLSGLVRCGFCGSSMIVSKQPYGSGETRRLEPVYICNYRSHRGSTACSNSLRPKLVQLDHAVLSAIEQQVLTPQVIRAAVRRAIELKRGRAAKRVNRPAELRRALVQVEAERERYAQAIGMGGALETLVAKLREAEQREKALRGELVDISTPIAVDELGAKRLEKVYTERLGRWRELLADAPATAREAIQALMPPEHPIQLTPQKDGGYLLKGATKVGALLFPALSGSAKVASPRGFEPRLPP